MLAGLLTCAAVTGLKSISKPRTGRAADAARAESDFLSVRIGRKVMKTVFH
jgi:hypothetical protein